MLEKTKWVIAASRHQTKIFEHDELTTELKCISVITDMAGRKKSKEFGQDRLGARRGKFSGKNTSQDGGKNPHEVETSRFALQLADLLEQAYTEKRFLRAVLFAEPHFLGLIKQNLKDKISTQIEWVTKDLAKASTVELEKQLSL